MAAVFTVSVAIVQVVHMVLVDHGFVSAFRAVGVAVVLGGAVVGRGHGWSSRIWVRASRTMCVTWSSAIS